jgi:hypothetical protein
MDEPMWTKSSRENAEPKRVMSINARLDAIQQKPLRDKELPMDTLSSTDTDDATRRVPNTAKEAPMCPTVRSANDAPTFV